MRYNFPNLDIFRSNSLIFLYYIIRFVISFVIYKFNSRIKNFSVYGFSLRTRNKTEVGLLFVGDRDGNFLSLLLSVQLFSAFSDYSKTKIKHRIVSPPQYVIEFKVNLIISLVVFLVLLFMTKSIICAVSRYCLSVYKTVQLFFSRTEIKQELTLSRSVW